MKIYAICGAAILFLATLVYASGQKIKAVKAELDATTGKLAITMELAANLEQQLKARTAALTEREGALRRIESTTRKLRAELKQATDEAKNDPCIHADMPDSVLHWLRGQFPAEGQQPADAAVPGSPTP